MTIHLNKRRCFEHSIPYLGVTELHPTLVKERLCYAVARAAINIAADSYERMTQGDAESVVIGYWPPDAYAHALEKLSTLSLQDPELLARHHLFKRDKSYFHGFPNTEDTGMRCIPDDQQISGKVGFSFVRDLKADRSPSEAITCFQNALVLGDSTQMCQVAHHQALLEVLGTKRFDKLFQNMLISQYSLETPLDVFLKYECVKNDDSNRRIVELGQRVLFLNHHNYSNKHINGEMVGLSAICINPTHDHQRFVALGLDPGKRCTEMDDYDIDEVEGVSEYKINRFLMKEYNKSPINESVLFEQDFSQKIRESYSEKDLKTHQYQRNHQISWEDFNGPEEGGIQADGQVGFNIDKVILALKMPIEELSLESIKAMS